MRNDFFSKLFLRQTKPEVTAFHGIHFSLVFAGISSIMKLYLPEEVTVTGKHLFPPPANTRYPEAPYGDTFMVIWPDKRKEFP